jgi:hypothetical protein
MLTREGVVKILDFGLAQRTPLASKPDEATATGATVHRMVMGTSARWHRNRPPVNRPDRCRISSVWA